MEQIKMYKASFSKNSYEFNSSKRLDKNRLQKSGETNQWQGNNVLDQLVTDWHLSGVGMA